MRLELCLEMLKQNIDNENEKEKPRAAAIIVSIKNRLIKRIEEIKKVKVYAENVENAMKEEMEKWLERWLRKAIERTRDLYKEIEKAKDIHPYLVGINNLLDEAHNKAAVLKRKTLRHKTFEDIATLSSILFNVKRKIKERINNVELLLVAGKPWFIAFELRKTSPEKIKVAEEIENALAYLLKKDFDNAKKSFEKALKFL